MRLLQCSFRQASRPSSVLSRQWHSTKSRLREPVLAARSDAITSDAPHNSLATFLAYADRTGLSKESTVYNGTYYEYVCLEALKKLGFELSRSGGRDDAGIDLIGKLHLPSQDHPLHCIVQCKALNKKLGPSLVRELEGSFAGAPVEWRGNNVIGVLCSPKPATKGVREALQSSGRGAMWVLVGGIGEAEGSLKQAIWNQKVGDLGAEGVGVGAVYRQVEGAEQDEMKEEIRLTWKGQIWSPTLTEGL